MQERFDIKKVAFVGTSCIGKTTLIEELQKTYGNDNTIAYVPEAARVFFTQNILPEEERFTAGTQGQVQDLALLNEQQAHAHPEVRVILCDRSVIDAVVYTKAHGDEEGSESLLRKVEYWLPTYNKFLLLDPTDIPYQTDDVRKEDASTRERFHQAFLDFFSEQNLPFEILSGTPEKRIQRVKEILGE